MSLNNVKDPWTTEVTVVMLSRDKDSEFGRIFNMQIDDDLLHYLVMGALLACYFTVDYHTLFDFSPSLIISFLISIALLFL